MTFGTVVGYLLGILIIFVAAKIFFAPLKIILKFIINSIVGIGVMLIINLLSPVLNIYIGINAVSALYKNGIVNGRENGIFAPRDLATRAEAAVIISRAMNLIK